jgi:hypothetical protein
MRTDVRWWIEWPLGAVRTGVVFLVLATAIGAAVRLSSTISQLGEEASSNARLSYTDREIAGGNGVVEDQLAAYEARARIPVDDAYHVAVSDDFKAETALTVPYVANFFHYFLMPRRQAEGAPWVVCYGCDLAAYGDSAEVVWTNGAGISIVRLRR